MESNLQLPESARSVLISRNPKAGARSGLPTVERLSGLLAAQDFQVETLTDIDELSSKSAQLLRDGELRCVVSAGGDGTVALLANRLPRDTPLAVLPLGTENLLSKHLQMRGDPAEVCQTICEGRAQKFDAGRAGDQIFLIMAGCGFDAEVVRRLHNERTGHIHHLSYAKPIWDSIHNYDYPELRVHCEIPASDSTPARTQTITARWAFVVNLPRYAGGLRIAPDASGNDGLLDVCTFKDGSLWSGLRYLSGVILGQHASWDDCVTVRAAKIRIDSDSPVPLQLDGDPSGFLPTEIDVLPDHLTLLVPLRASLARRRIAPEVVTPGD
ncbi:MAG TPA: diacylglycerol kinase family protein [Pirellulaceae bacterium]|nr:diacylglycerol kinase family protein [Pirellulaceae bacterium]